MIDIPVGKALVPVEADGCSNECVLFHANFICDQTFPCSAKQRKDGKNVIFKLVSNEKIDA